MSENEKKQALSLAKISKVNYVGGSDSGLLRITVRTTEPAEAKLILAEVLAQYLADINEPARERSQEMLTVLEKQKEELKDQLRKKQEQLADLKRVMW